MPFANNCRTAEVLADRGDVRVGTVADCTRMGSLPTGPTPLAGLADAVEAATGLPFPRNQGVLPSRGAMNETYQIHLTAVRIGEVLLGTCPCEPQTDQVVNFKTRTDAVVGNLYQGYEWPCVDQGEASVLCSFPDPSQPPSFPAPKARWELAKAQVHNDARDPVQPGNFSKVELGAGTIDALLYAGPGGAGTISFAGVPGFPVTFMVAQAQDYIGYIVSYREFMARDHYRKTLTSFGPHSADYVNTWLLRAARVLRTGEPDPLLGLFSRPPPDPQREAEYQAFAGVEGEAAVAAYQAALPDDHPLAGTPHTQPAARSRFGVARFSWYGGSNATDLPTVAVAGPGYGATNDYGEVVTTVAFPATRDAPEWAAAGRPYVWTAHWEVPVDAPPGEYRFVVRGTRRQGGRDVPYELVSDPFVVSPWRSGARVSEPVAGEGVVTFTVEVLPYPQEYFPEDAADPRKPRFIGSGRPDERVYRRTFRPRPAFWEPVRALVTVVHGDGSQEKVPAFPGTGCGPTPPEARCFVAALELGPGDGVLVLPSDVTDAFGNPAG